VGGLLNPGKKKAISSRTYPVAERGLKITVRVGNSNQISDTQIEPLP
jgi:hypothetical protein